MSTAMVLPMVWATAASLPEIAEWRELPEVGEHKPVVRGMAFYRRYTEAILRRYVAMSMECGRAPSLLGREMFRGKVTSYRVHSFEDVVIFVHDVEKCLAKLDIEQRQLVERVALQEYTIREAAGLLGLGLNTVVRQYARALDLLTRSLLDAQLLDPMKCCQEVQSGGNDVTTCFDWR
jgi:Sigma-70, region 4